MNKSLFRIIIVTLVLLATLSACNKAAEETKPAETNAPVELETTMETTEAETHPQLEDWEIETTAATEPEETKSTETEPVETEPEETMAEETKPAETKPQETKPQETESESSGSGEMTYEKYMSMSAEEQQTFFDSFESIDAYLAWYDAALAEYENNITNIEGGSVDLGDFID